MTPSLSPGLPQAEPPLSRASRRATGVYYTPPVVAQFMAQGAIAHWSAGRGPSSPPIVLDPACGAGAFLIAAAGSLRERLCAENGARLLPSQLVGVDIDPAALDQARQELAAATDTSRDVWQRLHLADALQPQSCLGSEMCDVILCNPPYLSIRELARQKTTAEVQAWRERFVTARGNFDLYGLFIEQALAWLRPGGVGAFLIPNKFATLDYARPLRELLLQRTTLLEWIDASSCKIFPQASVYPQIILFRKELPQPDSSFRFRVVCRTQDFAADRVGARQPQAQLSAAGFLASDDLRVEDRVPTQPLGLRAKLACGTTGYAAQRMAALLTDDETTERRGRKSRGEVAGVRVPFVVSGNIDPFCIHRQPVRFLGRTYQSPSLSLISDELTSHQRQLYARPKLIIAGLAQRLEAAFDETGHALGVQVYAVVDWLDDPFYLLGLLNSSLWTALFRRRFAAKKLAGNYFAVNKGQLAHLPVRVVEAGDTHGAQLQQGVSELARELHRRENGDSRGEPTAAADELDALVRQLYRVELHELSNGVS